MDYGLLSRVLENSGFECVRTYRGRDLDSNLMDDYSASKSLVLISNFTIDEKDGDWMRLDFEIWSTDNDVIYESLTSRRKDRVDSGCIDLSRRVLEKGRYHVMVVPEYEDDRFVYDVYS